MSDYSIRQIIHQKAEKYFYVSGVEKTGEEISPHQQGLTGTASLVFDIRDKKMIHSWARHVTKRHRSKCLTRPSEY